MDLRNTDIRNSLQDGNWKHVQLVKICEDASDSLGNLLLHI